MELKDFYKLFPSRRECIIYLEGLRWKGGVFCPYCNTKNPSPLPKENRYHCNRCHASFSVTVGTPFHRTRIDLQKWFATINLLISFPDISLRQLANKVGVTKDTASLMLNKLRTNKPAYLQDIKKIKDHEKT